MPRIYKLSRTGLKILYKIRHHKGHGIHSPFVFNLINKVIEEKTPYYVYDDIRTHLKSVPELKLSLQKDNLLMFRLINYFGAKEILEIGSGCGVNTVCMTAPSSNVNCMCVELSEKRYTQAQLLYKTWDRKIELHTEKKLPNFAKKLDCISINLNNYPYISEDIIKYLFDLSHEKTFIIVKGIRTNKRHQMLWRRITDMEMRTAVLDLFNIGIIFFDKKLYRWNYQISF